MATKVTLSQLSTGTLVFTAKDSNGNPYDMSGGEVRLTVWDWKNDGVYQFTTVAGAGIALTGDNNEIATVTYNATVHTLNSGLWTYALWHLDTEDRNLVQDVWEVTQAVKVVT